MDISLPDFGNDTVLQIYDIGVPKSELERIERITEFGRLLTGVSTLHRK
jgi:hypothetical protein